MMAEAKTDNLNFTGIKRSARIAVSDLLKSIRERFPALR